MSVEENKVIIQRYFDELFNKQDYSKADEIIHEDFTYSFGGGFRGVEGHKKHTADIHSMFSNLQNRVLDMAVEESRAVVLGERTGIQDKEYGGIPATNKSFSYRYANAYEFRDGKIVRLSTEIVSDMLRFYQALGVLPSTKEFVKNYIDSLK